MPSWKKVVTFGSAAQLSSLDVATNVTASEVSASTFIGDLQGTASWALNAVNTSGTASYAVSSSYSDYTLSASHALTASSADNFLIRGSLTGTSGNFSGNVTASNLLVSNTITANRLVVQVITSSTEYVTGSTIFGSQLTDTHQFTGSVSITGSLGINGVDYSVTSASFDQRILQNSASIAALTSSFVSSSSELSSSLALLSSSFLSTSQSLSASINLLSGSS
jgi:hypothetical protein